MKAVVMAGGEGTRLRPMTSSMPKPLLPVVNRPIMEHVLRLLKRHGLNETVVTVQFLASLVKNYFGDGEELGMELTYANEEKPLGTAGSVKNAEEALKDDTFLVISGDALTDFDLTDLINFHKEKGAMVTVCLTRVPNPLEFGITIVDEEGKVERFLEKPTWGQVFSDTVNTGIYVMEPEVFDYVEADVSVDWSGDVFPQLMKEGKPVFGYIAEGYWEDVGTHESYVKAQADVLEGKVDVEIDGFEISPGVWVAEGAEVHPDAVLRGPLYIGDYAKVEADAEIREHTVVGSNVVVKSGAFLHRAVVHDNVYIGQHSNLRGCVIGKNTDIMRAARIEDGAVIGDECLVGEESIIQGNVRVYPFKTIEAGAFVNTSVIWESRGQAHLFGARGVTGILNVEITPELAVRLAGAYATTLKKGSTVTTARDHSRGARALKRAVISALQASAIDVRDLENVPLPVARQQTARGSAGGIMIRTTPGVPDSVDIMFFDGQGADLSQGGSASSTGCSRGRSTGVRSRGDRGSALPRQRLRFVHRITAQKCRHHRYHRIRSEGGRGRLERQCGAGAAQSVGQARCGLPDHQSRSRRIQAHGDVGHAAGRPGAAGRDRRVRAGRVRGAFRPGGRAALARRREGADRRGRPGPARAARPGGRGAAQWAGGAAGDHHADRRAGGGVPRDAGGVDDDVSGRSDEGRTRGVDDLRR